MSTVHGGVGVNRHALQFSSLSAPSPLKGLFWCFVLMSGVIVFVEPYAAVSMGCCTMA